MTPRRGSLSLDLGAFCNRTLNRHATLKRGVGIELFGAIITSNPVGDPDGWQDRKAAAAAEEAGYTGGRSRANWNFSVNIADMSTKDDTAFNGDSLQLAQDIQAADPLQTFVITNSLPYIQRLEQGHSQQAPEGMVQINVRRFRNIVSKVLRTVKRTT